MTVITYLLAQGLSINYVDKFLGIFDHPPSFVDTWGSFIKDVINFLRFLTPPPPSSSLLLNKLIK